MFLYTETQFLPLLANINCDLILKHLGIEVIFRLLPALCRSMLENGENGAASLGEICGLCVANRSYKDEAVNVSDTWVLQQLSGERNLSSA